MLDRLPSALLLIDAQGLLAFANEAARELLDLPPETGGLGAPLPLVPATLADDLRRFQGRAESRTVLVTLDDGVTLPVGYRASSAPGASPGAGGTVVVLRDLRKIYTSRRENRTNLMRTTAQVLMSSLLHEIRNPLFAATSGIEVALLERGLPLELSQHLEQVGTELDRIRESLKELQELVLEQRTPQQPLRLARLLEQGVLLYQDQFDAKGLKVTLGLPDRPTTVRLDLDRFNQLLSYLVEFVVEAAPVGSRIEVSLVRQETEETAQLCVRYPGRPRVDLDLDRALRALRIGGGAHVLGLAVAKTIALEHRGNLQLEAEGECSVLRVTLPLVAPTLETRRPQR